ncbi:MAG: hypothetical protein NZ551_04705 [Microscillaceae bacterium]|nr:hypothetical protein [Microscillaceae bacterium]MDW8460493.1 hypothetical protein [Cytophagales bacterium]
MLVNKIITTKQLIISLSITILVLCAKLTWAGSPAQPQLSKQEQKAQKFLQSKVGKWLIKKTTQIAVKKYNNLVKEAQNGNVKAQQKLAKIKEPQKHKKVSGDLKVGIILVAIGVVLSVLRIEVLAIIGVILIVVGLVIILLDIL